MCFSNYTSEYVYLVYGTFSLYVKLSFQRLFASNLSLQFQDEIEYALFYRKELLLGKLVLYYNFLKTYFLKPTFSLSLDKTEMLISGASKT